MDDEEPGEIANWKDEDDFISDSEKDDYSSDARMDEGGHKISTRREITVLEANQMRIKRDDLEKWIDADDLEQVIWGGFVKINQGEGNNQTIYKIMRVVGLKTLTPYYFGKKETSKWIKMYEFDIKIAKSFKMKLISN